MEKIKLLLVDDNKDFVEMLYMQLDIFGYYDICIAYDGSEGFEKYKSFKPDIIVADIEMPRMDGKKMVRIIRENDSFTPVFFLSSHNEKNDSNAGMEAGSDFYIVKPVNVNALDATIRNFLKKTSNKPLPVMGKDELAIGSFGFSASNKYLIRNGKKTELTKTEARILYLLVAKKGDLLLRNEIITYFENIDNTMSTSTLNVHICNIRKKLNEDLSIEIVAVRGEGFILKVSSGNE